MRGGTIAQQGGTHGRSLQRAGKDNPPEKNTYIGNRTNIKTFGRKEGVTCQLLEIVRPERKEDKRHKRVIRRGGRAEPLAEAGHRAAKRVSLAFLEVEREDQHKPSAM
jgi:hypothetical protein